MLWLEVTKMKEYEWGLHLDARDNFTGRTQQSFDPSMRVNKIWNKLLRSENCYFIYEIKMNEGLIEQ